MRVGFIKKVFIVAGSLIACFPAACLAASGEAPPATSDGGAHLVLTISANGPLGPNLELFGSLSTSVGTAEVSPQVLVDSAGLSGCIRGFSFTVGRNPTKWGPGRFGALLLSDNAPLDATSISFPLGDVDYTQLIGARDVAQGQYLLGHRIEWAPRKGLTLGLSETLAFSRDFKLSSAYLVPGLPYHIVQYFAIHGDSRQDRYTNILAGIDARLKLSERSQLYGEFLIDDFPWSPSSWGRVPPMIGLLLGLELEDLPWLGYSTLSAEYARLNNYVYSHKNPDNAYLHRGELLGHWLGPDADALCVEVARRVSPSVGLAVRARFERHGEGKIGESWRNEYGVRNQFLSGIIETRKVLGVAAAWPHIEVGAEIASLGNAGHIPGESRLVGEVGVSIGWHFGSAVHGE